MAEERTPPQKPDDRVQTQASRRLKYGVNVAVAVVAAVVLVVLVNWIASRQYVPIDLTATRQYSLSDQTRRILGRLDADYRIVTLFRPTSIHMQRVGDLVDLYDRYSDKLSVERIDPDRDIARRDAFFAQLVERHEREIAPVRDAVEEGRAALDAVAQEMGALVEPLQQAIDDPQLQDDQLKQFLGSLRAALARTPDQITQVRDAVQRVIDRPLPDYAAAQSQLQSVLDQLDGNLFAIAADRLAQATNNPAAPTGLQDALLRLSDRVNALRTKVRDASDALSDAHPGDRYTELVNTLTTNESIVVLGPEQVRVLPVTDLFRRPDPEAVAQAGEAAELRFLGEERLTGALVSLSIEKPALIVFVHAGPGAALGPGGQYEYVAQRLRAANFEVEQWNPAGQFSPMGGRLPAGNPPTPDEGQKRVWVVLPFPPVNPMNPAAAGNVKPSVADAVSEGLANGDSALFVLSATEGAAFITEDPVADLVKQWAITPQLDRIIFQEVQLAEHRTAAGARFVVTDWPDAMPVSAALGGMSGRFDLPAPLVIGKADGVTTWPLIRLAARRMWADADYATAQSADDIQYEEATAQDEFVIGAAAEKKDGGRVIVTSAGGLPAQPQYYPPWPHDQATTLSLAGVASRDFAEVFGAAYPANAELFVNSVYWLAGLDELIAASPRTQDIRRIDPALRAGTLNTVRWVLLGGLPVAVVAAGMGVWLVRRRG